MGDPLDLDAIREYLIALDLREASAWGEFDRRGPLIIRNGLAVIKTMRQSLMLVESITAERPADFTNRDYDQLRQSIKIALALVKGTNDG